MDIPLNADKIIGMTEGEATDWIKLHNPDLNLHITSKDGQKMPIKRMQSNAIYAAIEDDFITSFFIT